jgi:hypothetical protein
MITYREGSVCRSVTQGTKVTTSTMYTWLKEGASGIDYDTIMWIVVLRPICKGFKSVKQELTTHM